MSIKTTDGMTDLKQASTEQIANRYAALQAQIEDMRLDMDSYKRELLRRMQAEKATKLYHSRYHIGRSATKKYKYTFDTAFKIANTAHAMGIPQDIIEKAITITGNPEYKVRRPGVEALATYGGQLTELLNECEVITEEDTLSFAIKKE